jgi:hypothetical protein
MKDITSTSFGLLIAFFLPGLAGFYGLAFWSPTVKNVFDTFLTAESNVGLFFLVFAGAVIIGLQVTLLRWFLFERLLCKSVHFDPSDFDPLGKDEKKLAAFRSVADEHYRYHQFWGGMFVVIPILFFGWLIQSWSTLHCFSKISSIVGFALVEIVTSYGAVIAFHNYVTRGKQILKGE